ncbi:HesA/MoeB/ThiF family protein [Natronospira bacteriovora]|uniref:HesA/MoeB/ThiF family protein n=1 Tax=Natronospira bacteriovora TaxID=3069753 RepID=A0ABU0W402_9GAMM|nr:HesA/MoeB/ThiF family protein [Natronospira sp. AB-CW4]MDQ2068748.1 HesA/MoeB/ThiF family protein [Natronospira sp. AB-CW4]
MNDTRYARHHALPGFGPDAQALLARSRVLVIGVGGLGCASAAYLTAAGVGELMLADFDTVDEANLQRQILFGDAELGRRKVEAAAERLHALNGQARIRCLDRRLDEPALRAAAEEADVIVDGSDNFPTRFNSNRASLATRTPLVSGSAIRWQGQLAVFDPVRPASGCYACLFDELAPDEDMGDCARNGVLSPLVGVIGSMQAVETIKLLTHCGDSVGGRLLRYDALSGRWQESRFARDPECTACGDCS